MPNGDAKGCEILLGQACQGRTVNFIFGEHLGVAVEAEAFKPLAQFAHGQSRHLLAKPFSHLYHDMMFQTRKRLLLSDR